MRLPRLLVAASIAALLAGTAACSGSPQETSPGPDSLAVNQTVTALLPIGPHDISITQTTEGANGPRIVTVDGYLDLGGDPFGRDCELDLQLLEDVNGSRSVFLARRAAGQESYHQIVEGDSDTGIAFEPGTWHAAATPSIPAPVLFFAPNFLSEGVGVVDGAPGGYCTWRLLDRVASLGTDGQLIWDLDAAAVLLDAAVRNFAGDILGDRGADELLSTEDVTLEPSEDLLGTLRIEKDAANGTITMHQSYDGSVVRETKVRFTPTQKRAVEPIVQP